MAWHLRHQAALSVFRPHDDPEREELARVVRGIKRGQFRRVYDYPVKGRVINVAETRNGYVIVAAGSHRVFADQKALAARCIGYGVPGHAIKPNVNYAGYRRQAVVVDANREVELVARGGVPKLRSGTRIVRAGDEEAAHREEIASKRIPRLPSVVIIR